MACIRLSDDQVWTAASWVFEAIGRSMEAAFGEANEVTDLFKKSVMNGSYWVDLRHVDQVSISNLSLALEGIADDPTHPAGFSDLDRDYQDGLLDRVSELQQQLARILANPVQKPT